MPRTPEEILNLADKAVRIATRGRPGWSIDDWNDMRQEAALAIWKQGDAHEGACVLAAKHAAFDWMRIWLRTPRGLDWLDYVDYSDPFEPSWTLDFLNELMPMLEAQRAEHAARDVAYLRLRLSRVSTAGIAQELAVSERVVYAIREHLLPRLERIAKGEPAPPIVVNVHDNSRTTLEKINSDPEVLARRAAAIRAGWARRKQKRQQEATCG